MSRKAKPTYKDALAEIAELEKTLEEVMAEKAEWKECARKLVLHSFVRADAAADGGLNAEDVAAALKSVRSRGLKTLDDIAKCDPAETLATYRAFWQASDSKVSGLTEEEQAELAEILS